LAERRRLIVFNRRTALALGLTMGELAAEYAEAIVRLGAPVDVVGVSTGGSIAQQLAADHCAVVGRVVPLSAACRLGGVGRRLQSTVAAELRAGRMRRAVSVAAGGIAPKFLRPFARGVGWLAAPRVVTSQAAAADLAVTLEAEDGFDLAKCEGRIQAPMLIIAGGRDRFYSPALFRETAALIPGSDLRLLASRGHLTVMRDRRALAMIAGFLSWPDLV
jgi:pimeloyl-ACP methyl ester carboxylesterase